MKSSWRQYLERVLGVILPTSAAGLAVAAEAAAKESLGLQPGSTSRLRDIDPVPFSTPMRLNGPDQFAGHRSHSSHRSHRSHYSGSSGTYRSAPSSSPPAASPAPSSPATTPPQKVVPLPSTAPKGAASPGTILAAPGAVRSAPSASAAPGGAATDQGLLVAMRAQLELKRLGHYNGTIDGIVGPDTQGALRRFQQSQNLTQSGVLDNATLSKLGIQP